MKKNYWVHGVAALLCPGLGHLLQKRVLDAFIIFLSVSVPIFWACLLFNELYNQQIVTPSGEPATTFLSFQFMAHIGELKHVRPAYYVMLVLTAFVHLWAARNAWLGPETDSDETINETTLADEPQVESNAALNESGDLPPWPSPPPPTTTK